MKKHSTLVAPPRLPLPLGVRSNGEYFWTPTEREAAVARVAHELAAEHARHVGLDRRGFLSSVAGVATTLAATNLVSGCKAYETGDLCDATGQSGPLTGTEFVFDVQTHHVELASSWRDTNFAYQIFYDDLLAESVDFCDGGDASCFDFEHYLDLVFGQSDTTVAVLSGIPALSCEDANPGELCGFPIDNAGMAASRDRLNQLASSGRMLSHAMVTPNEGIDRALRQMEQDAKTLSVRAWKCYTPWGQIPAEDIEALEAYSEEELILMAAKGEIHGTGWRLDDPDVGIPFVEKGLELGVPIFCCHKGLPLPTFDPAFTGTDDLCAVAAAYPEARFVAYHSAYCAGAMSFLERLPEGPYDGPDADPAMAGRGINNLIDSLLAYGLGPQDNVYGELGGLWSSVYADAVQAQHVLGKLLKYLGPKRILWGTDAIWIGTPQPLIEAFRALTITPEFQDAYGYPELTDEDKARILGLNAAELYGIDPHATRCAVSSDELAARHDAFRERRVRGLASIAAPQGPRTRREFFRNAWSHKSSPA